MKEGWSMEQVYKEKIDIGTDTEKLWCLHYLFIFDSLVWTNKHKDKSPNSSPILIKLDFFL